MLPETDQAADTPPASLMSRPALRAWLLCAALYYPILWLSLSLVWSGPSVVRLAVDHERLEAFQWTPLLVVIQSAPRGDPHSGGRRPPWDSRLQAALGPAVAAALVLTFLGRKVRLSGGLILATLATAGFATQSLALRSPETNAEGRAAAALAGLLLLVLAGVGARWMLEAWPDRPAAEPPGSWGRAYALRAVKLASVLALFPTALVPALGRTFGWHRFSALVPLLAVPGLLAALIVSVWPASGARREPRRHGWRAVGAGALVTVFFALAVPRLCGAVHSSLEQARVVAVRAELASLPAMPADAPYPRLFFQRGVNFTAEWPDRYDSKGARQMLRQLPASGVNAIALVPYGWSSMHPPQVHAGGGPDTWESDGGIEILARLAHSLGMKVMLKPAIWQGYELDGGSPQDRAAWFADYEKFLEKYARLAVQIHADLFCIGGEFEHLTADQADWRRMIARVRQIYPGPLVYAANFGNEFEHVAFWDALDYIGLQEYYPLPDDLSTAEVLAKVEAVESRYHKPVIFTEAGFPAETHANRAPWQDGRSAHLDLAAQASCYQAVFNAFYRQPWFEGVYWWKVGTDGGGGGHDASLTPWNKPAMQVVSRWYLQGGR